jgi:hypothetical protein
MSPAVAGIAGVVVALGVVEVGALVAVALWRRRCGRRVRRQVWAPGPDQGVTYSYIPPVSPDAMLARRLVAMELAELTRMAERQRDEDRGRRS